MEISQEVRQEICRLSTEYQECERKLDNAGEALEDYVRSYLTENHLWESSKDIMSVIRILPGGHTRFTLFTRLSELSKKR